MGTGDSRSGLARRAIAGLGVVLILAALVLWITGSPSDAPRSTAARIFHPLAGSQQATPVRPARFEGPLGAYLTVPTLLRARPGGHVLARLARRTEFGSPRILGVLRRRGDWLGVTTPELPNGRIGWIRTRGVQLIPLTYSIAVDLSRRQVTIRRRHSVVARFTVAVGRPGNETPIGRFSVTDKLRVTAPGSPYGCCALALSAHQVNLPPGWQGGDRVALHATNLPSSIGQAVSLGCLRAPTRLMRRLVRLVPLGTPVFIRA